MPIKRSSAPQIRRLIDDLCGSDDVRRETAVARLAVIGVRAVPPVIAVVDSAEALPSRLAALRALEGLEDDRVLDAAHRRLDHPDLAPQALSVLKSLLPTKLGAAALDIITAVALDESRPEDVRLAALDALAEVPRRTLRPIWARLSKDQSAAVRQKVGAPAPASPVVLNLETAASGASTDPASLRQALTASGGTAPLATLHRLIQVIRDREAGLKEGRLRAEWTMLRGAVHHVLASRGSRVALYDMRESIAQTDSALPVEFLAAVSEIGDASCLEPLAHAYVRASTVKVAANDWWRQHLLSTLQAVISREKLTKRHAVIKRVLAKWPELKAEVFLT